MADKSRYAKAGAANRAMGDPLSNYLGLAGSDPGAESAAAQERASRATSVEATLARARGDAASGARVAPVKSAADLAAYRKTIQDARYLVGQAGDEHPAVARMYEKADNARADVFAEKRDPALRAAFQAGRKKKAAAPASGGRDKARPADPHDLKDGWYVRNNKGTVFWRRANGQGG